MAPMSAAEVHRSDLISRIDLRVVGDSLQPAEFSVSFVPLETGQSGRYFESASHLDVRGNDEVVR
jgi:hypothetical protein